MKRISFVLLSLIFLCISFPLSATISVIPVIVTINKTNLLRSDVTVTNQGDEDAYVKATAYKITNPGTKQERKEIIHNPEEAGLLVSPRQLIIPPKQRRVVRLMATKPLDNTEHIYHVEIVPVAGELIPKAQGQGLTAGLQLLVGYGVLTMIKPLEPHFNLEVRRKGKILFLNNKSNANVEFFNLQQCLNNKCHAIKETGRLYAGNNRQIALKEAVPVTLSTLFFDKQEILTSH